MEIYSQYWIVNLSGVDLAIADGRHQSFVRKVPLLSCIFPQTEMPVNSGQSSSDVNLRLKTYKRNGELVLMYLLKKEIVYTYIERERHSVLCHQSPGWKSVSSRE